MNSTYQYIILSSPWDLYTAVFRDITYRHEVTYIANPSKNRFLSKLFFFLLHPKLNKIIKIPFKRNLNKLIFRRVKSSDHPLCFILYYGWYTIDNHMVEDIRKNYPNVKIVIYFTDLIKIQKMRFSHSPIDMEYLKTISDLIITYDIEEAKEYNILHYDVPLSFEKNILVRDEPIYDVYFIGQAKDRLPVIMGIYSKLVELNLRVNFILSNVQKEFRKRLPGITYVNGCKISYSENIQNVKKCRCILEIIQGKSSGQTFRTKEAVAYDKKLITNNKNIKKTPFYNPEYICVFEKFDDIDYDFLKNLKSTDNVDYRYKENLSPLKLLEFIENKFKDETK